MSRGEEREKGVGDLSKGSFEHDPLCSHSRLETTIVPFLLFAVVLTKKKPTGGMNGVPKSAEAVRGRNPFIVKSSLDAPRIF